MIFCPQITGIFTLPTLSDAMGIDAVVNLRDDRYSIGLISFLQLIGLLKMSCSEVQLLIRKTARVPNQSLWFLHLNIHNAGRNV